MKPNLPISRTTLPLFGIGTDSVSGLHWLVRLRRPFMVFCLATDRRAGRDFDAIFSPKSPSALEPGRCAKMVSRMIRWAECTPDFTGAVRTDDLPFPELLNIVCGSMVTGVLDLRVPSLPLFAHADATRIDDTHAFRSVHRCEADGWCEVPLQQVSGLTGMEHHLQRHGVFGRSTRSIQIEAEKLADALAYRKAMEREFNGGRTD
jgi:hypothetical protein